MKTKLLFSAFILSVGAFAQEPIASFYPSNSLETNYTLATSTPAIDDSATGQNANWNFSNLTAYGYSITFINAPTAEQISTYPGVTSVVATNSDSSSYTSEFYLSNANNNVLVAGASSNGIILNYDSDNLDLGTFPKSYGNAAVTDAVAGTYTGDGITGTFSGTAVTSVDGYGTLTVNIGGDGNPDTLTVTRLKIEQTLNLYLSGISIGTITQVMYNYYAEYPQNAPVFRTLTSTINLPSFNINETQQSIESYYDVIMGVKDISSDNKINIAPNPVANVLHFSGNVAVKAVTVTDVTGKVVLSSNESNNIDVSGLNTGVYFVAVQAANGTEVRKMIKQ